MHLLRTLPLLAVCWLSTPGGAAETGGAPAQAPPDAAGLDNYGDPLPKGAVARLGTLRLRHGGPIHSIAFSPDGRLVATGGGDRLIYLHDVKTGQTRGIGRAAGIAVNYVRFSTNGKMLLSRDGGTVRLWEVGTMEERLAIATPADHPGIVRVAWSPDDRTVAVCANLRNFKAKDLKQRLDGTIRFYSATTGRELTRWDGTGVLVESLAFAPGGKELWCAASDGSLRVIDPVTGKELRRADGPRGGDPLGFLNEGGTVAVANRDGWLHLLDAATGKEQKRFKTERMTVGGPVRFSRDGRLLASFHPQLGAKADKPGEIRVRSVLDGTVTHTFPTPERLLYDLAFAPDKRTLAAAGWARQPVQFWDLKSGQPVRVVTGHEKRVTSVAFSAAGGLVYSAAEDDTVRVWDARKGREIRSMAVGQPDPRLALSKDNKYLATVGRHPSIRLWDAVSGELVKEWAAPKLSGATLAFSPDGKTLATGGNDAVIYLWDVPGGERKATLKGHELFIRSVAFSPDGKRLVSASGDKTVRVWDLAKGEAVTVFHGHTTDIKRAVFAPDGKTVASGCLQQLLLWVAETGKLVRNVPRPPGGAIEAFAFSPNGRYLAVGPAAYGIHQKIELRLEPHDDFDVLLWDLKTGKIAHRFHGHCAWVAAVAFSPDGKLLVSGSNDTTALVWQVPSRAAEKKSSALGGGAWEFCSFQDAPARSQKAAVPEPLHILRTFSGVLCAALSPDGQRIAIGGKAGVLELWDTERAVVMRKFEGHSGDVRDVFFTPDGKRLVSAAGLYETGGDQTVRVWDVGTGKELRKFAGFGNIVSSAALSPDGASLALGHVGGTVGVRAMATGEERWRREKLGAAHTPVCVQFSASGRLVAVSGGYDRPVTLLDAADGKPRAPLPFNNPHRARPAFSPVQPLLAVPPPVRGVGAVLWDTDWGEVVLTLPEPADVSGVRSTAFSADGKVLAGGTYDGRVVLWEVASGRPICSFGAQRSTVEAVQFSADGKRLISVGVQGVALWELDDPAFWGADRGKVAAEELWGQLAGPDAAKAYRAMRALVREPAAALPLLRARLKPTSGHLDDLLRKLVRDLDSKEFRERERAYLELERRIKDAEPFLRYRLTLPASEEVRRRTRALLAKTTPSKGPLRQPGELVGETLRAVRAVQVLERIGSAEARKVLTALAAGAPGAPETRDAQAALKRLAAGSQ